MTAELADTSAWTTRRKDPAVSRDFERRLLAGELATCAMVKLELLWEARDVEAFRQLRDGLDALDEIPIDGSVWERAIDVLEQLAAQGPRHHRQLKLPDLLVAATAESAGMPVCHYDRDFDVIAGITGQPVRAIAPLGSL
jgi:predicted nucleic acid-binding protein